MKHTYHLSILLTHWNYVFLALTHRYNRTYYHHDNIPYWCYANLQHKRSRVTSVSLILLMYDMYFAGIVIWFCICLDPGSIKKTSTRCKWPFWIVSGHLVFCTGRVDWSHKYTGGFTWYELTSQGKCEASNARRFTLVAHGIIDTYISAIEVAIIDLGNMSDFDKLIRRGRKWHRYIKTDPIQWCRLWQLSIVVSTFFWRR